MTVYVVIYFLHFEVKFDYLINVDEEGKQKSFTFFSGFESKSSSGGKIRSSRRPNSASPL
jgi:hypothetical protein